MHHGNVRLRTVKIRILIPQSYNDGRPVDPALLEFFEDVFVALAGVSSPLGLLRGSWVDPDGSCLRDLNRVYEVVITSEQELRITQLIHAIGRLLKQHSIYYEIDRTTEVHIDPVLPRPPVYVGAENVKNAPLNGKAAIPLPHGEDGKQ